MVQHTLAKALQSAGASDRGRMFSELYGCFVCFVSLFFSTLVFLFIILRQVFCPRATCPLRPPEC